MTKSKLVAPCLALILALFLCAAPCKAWNSTGHEIVAQVAFDDLPADIKAKIVATLKFHPRLNQDLHLGMAKDEDPDRAIFLRAATWPDMVRYPTNPLNRTENHPRWHYVDYPYELEGVQGPPVAEQWDGKSDPANLLQAMQKAMKELADPKTPRARLAIDLCWVEHLTGDIHQPLHAISLYDKEYPNGDRGGNGELIGLVQNGQSISEPLHTFWDGAEGQSLDPAVIRKIADRIEQEHPASQLQDQLTKDTDVESWAKESLALAKTTVYEQGHLPHAVTGQFGDQQPAAPELTAQYEADAVTLADLRIALAGYRLDAELETIAKQLPP
jgi:S1/P1 Nuclease